jgi:hypothetical protein
MQTAGNVVLQVRGLAALGVRQRFDAGGPFAAGLQGGAPEGDVIDGYQFNLAFVEGAGLIQRKFSSLRK